MKRRSHMVSTNLMANQWRSQPRTVEADSCVAPESFRRVAQTFRAKKQWAGLKSGRTSGSGTNGSQLIQYSRRGLGKTNQVRGPNFAFFTLAADVQMRISFKSCDKTGYSENTRT